MEKKLSYYKSPTDYNNKPYWVPIVMKNKDSLVGYLNGMNLVTDQLGVEPEGFYAILSSERFNDVLRDGRRGGDVNDFDFKEYIRNMMLEDVDRLNMRDEHEGCSPLILIDYYLPLSCTCGNFFGFKEAVDIPDKQMKCDMCNHIVIDYTNKDDDDFGYDGIDHLERDIDEMIDDVRDELHLDEEDDEDENDLGF